MKYGHFDDARREYVINIPDTPLPWINYLGSEEYFGLISNTAGGYSFYKDARLRRLTRYRYNNAPLDMGGRYIYLRDNRSDQFWSPSWMPTRTGLDDYSCRHGLGYTIITSKLHDLQAETCYFVPLGQSLEIWQLKLTNLGAKAAELSVFAGVEFALWDAWDDATNFQRNFNTGEVEVENGVIYHKTEYRERRNHFAYFASSAKLAGYDTQREAFLGSYRGWDDPAVVQDGRSHNSLANGWQPVGVLHNQVYVPPGETTEIIFILGYFENPVEDKFDPPGSQTINKRGVQPLLKRFLNPQNVQAALQELRTYWESMLNILQVETPSDHTNRMINIWNAYQCMITFNMSRSASFYEFGVGRGMGFRDSNQDLLGFVHMAPQRARQRLLDLSATQLSNGGAYHQYQPLTKRGNNDVGSNFNDDPLWLVLGVTAYIKETGDWNILGERVPYDNQPGSELPVLEHLQRCIQYTIDRLGPHGLPLIGRADWNDCLNLNCFSDTPGQSFQTTTNKEGKVAESVFIGGLFVLACKEMAVLLAQPLFAQMGASRPRALEPERYLAYAREMEATVKAHGWDGAWFRRAYDDFGHPVGSKENEEGQIFIEPQGICIMAGIGLDDGRALQALDEVSQRLATPHGIVLQQPAYSHYYLHLGEISSYPPGYKENASIFCHTNPWIMIAEAMAGRGERALDYYLRINPSAREAQSERHLCEPYVYAQTIAGKDAPNHGEAKNSWLTGTAAWNYVAITQWILGIQPDYQGLRLAPATPANWAGFHVVRQFRGSTFDISFERSDLGSKISLVVDGQPVAGNIIPLPPTPGKVKVLALIS